ncbi:hypothetical protein FBZ87_101628 [Nitrospirillum amazonense]|uniref:Uncharacterized protein n=1 Tax=Nitrospirillum amazonense TaxID=28077 RepID=A0A560KI63_9PROT|nr:hypothetical protein FBZ87_101628 [Nitrospirillum amazonense]
MAALSACRLGGMAIQRQARTEPAQSTLYTIRHTSGAEHRGIGKREWNAPSAWLCQT